MNSHRGRPLLMLAIALLAAPYGAPARAASSRVDESSNSFSPGRVEIALNDKVVWTNRSSETHTVTFEDGTDLHSGCEPDAILQVGCQGPGATAERTFRTSGSYRYYCKFHGNPGGVGMAGVVVVLATATSASSPAASTTTTRASTTTTTLKPSTSSTTTTSRPLVTSSTQVPSSTTTTTSKTTSVLMPGDPPPLTDETSTAANESGRPEDETDSATVALIVALLLGVSASGGLLLWRLRPGRP